MQPQLLKHLIQKPVLQEQLAPMSDPVSFPAIRNAGRDNETFHAHLHRDPQPPTGATGATNRRKKPILVRTYMLAANGQSNGCVSFSDYNAFLQAYLRGKVTRKSSIIFQAHRNGRPSDWVSHRRLGGPREADCPPGAIHRF